MAGGETSEQYKRFLTPISIISFSITFILSLYLNKVYFENLMCIIGTGNEEMI